MPFGGYNIGVTAIDVIWGTGPNLAFNASDGGVPWDDLRKILQGSHRMASVHSGEEILPTGSTP